MSYGNSFLCSILLALALCVLGTQDVARACGGFFCTTAPMDQVGERILFIADKGVVTTHVQIQYNGDASDFAWILPLPSPPELQVSHNEVFRQLQFATQPAFWLNWQENEECEFFFPPVLATVESARDDAAVEVVSEQRVGPYQTAVITADDSEAVADWLQANGYNLDGLGLELLQPYVEDGYYFLALRLAPDREIGDLQPIAMTYAADNPGIPIRLTAVATQPDMGVLVWILGSHRAIPNNYLHVHINEARIDWFNGGFNYPQVVTEAANEAGGQAFATDYAGPSKIMDKRIYQEGRFGLDKLRTLKDPAEYINELLAQGFPRDNQMQALLRRHMPMPQIVLEQGVLEVVFRGDRKAYDQAAEEGRLQALAESSFYNNMRAYNEYTGELEYDLVALTEALEETVVEPLRAVQDLFGDFPYMTRLYTTLSAEEMTVDPMFSFNPDLPDVSNVHTADARWECFEDDPEKIDLENAVLVITLSDGREIRSRPCATLDPDDVRTLQPAAVLIEQMDESGPPVPIQRLTSVAEETEAPPLPAAFALLPNYPNPFNSGTVLPFRLPLSMAPDAVFSLQVYNLVGQPVRTLLEGPVQPGYGEAVWDGRDERGKAVPSGVYLYRLEGDGTRLSRKLLLLR